MIDSRTFAGLPPVMLFLKATVKKQIFVPSHTRHDGSFVAGHYKWVHVSDDHDEHKVLAGQGSHSQKIAHAKLSKLDSFKQLPHDHKVAVILAHATDHQNMDSANARVSTLVKKILSGEKPTPSEWRAWGYVDNDKREKAFSAVAEAGKGAFFQNSMDTAAVNEGHQARTDAVSPAADAPPAAPPAAEKPVPVKEPAKVEPEPAKVPAKDVDAEMAKVKPGAVLDFDSQYEKMNAGQWQVYNQTDDMVMLHKVGAKVPNQQNTVTIPKSTMAGAIGKGTAKVITEAAQDATHGKGKADNPKAAPEPGADHAKVKMLLGAAGLPSENVNAKHFNAKLASIKHAFEAGDVKALLGASYGTNTYGKKAAKLANEVLAVLGSKETVHPGQKAGTHAAAAGDKAAPSAPAPAPKVVAASVTEKPAAADMGNPITQQNQQNQPARPPKVVGAAAAVNPVSANSPAKPTEPHIVGSLAAKEIVTTITDKMEQGDAKTIEFMLMNLPKSTKLKWGKVKQYGEQAIAYVNAQKGKPAAPATPAASPVAGAPTAEQVATLSENELQDIFNAADAPASMTMDQVKASAKAGDINGVQAVLNALPPNGWPKTKVAITKILALMKEKQTKTTFTMSAGTPIDEPKEGDTKVENGKTYALKNGRWHLVGADLDAQMADAGSLGGAEITADLYLETHGHTPGNYAKVASALEKQGYFSLVPQYKKNGGGVVSLEESELPLKPPGASSKYYNDAQKFALAGNMAELKKLHTVLLNDGYASTHPVVMQMIDQLAAKQAATPAIKKPTGLSFSNQSIIDDAEHAVKKGNAQTLMDIQKYVAESNDFPPSVKQYIGSLNVSAGQKESAPAAPASAALSPDEIHAHSSKVDGSYANTAKELAAAGDMAGLQAHIDTLSDMNYPHTAGYAKELYAKMQEKSKGGAAVVGSAPAMALHPGELPYVDPNSVSSAEKMGIAGVNKAALDGNKESLDKLVNHLENGSNPASPVLAHAKKVQALMQAKAGGAAGGSAAAKPKKPDTTDFSTNAKHHVDVVEFMLKEGKVAPIEAMLANLSGDIEGADWGRAKAYTEKALAYLGGPKEGDTKQGADGMLVFQNGRWHKVKKEEPSGLSDEEVKKIKPPGASSTFANNVTALAKAGDIDGLKQLMKDMKGHKVPATRKFLKAAIAALEAKGLKGTKSKPKKKSTGAGTTAAAAAFTAMPITKTQSVKVGELTALVADKWEQTGPQKGSNPGGKFKDGKGQEWYCKFPSDPDTVKNELLAAKFYEMLGADVPHLRLVQKDGQLGIASKWVDGVTKGSADQLAKAKGAHEGFVFDAWLANWDVVGLSNDNLMLGKDGKAVRIDVGGSLVYRAQGGKKGADFGHAVKELKTLIDGTNSQSAAVFKGVTKADLIAGGKQLAKLKPSQIEEMCMKAGPGSETDKKELAKTLMARRSFILNELGLHDQWNKPPVDETKVRVNPVDIPDGIDFFHHPEKNNGPLSSKEWLNKQNTIDSKNLSDFAKQGNLKALKDYQYMAVDAAGKPIGTKPITEHPSNHIQKQWAAAVQTLQSIAYPPAETLEMPSFGYAGSIDEIAKEVGAFAPHENVTTVAAEHRLGYFMKLAQVEPEMVQEYVQEKKWKFIKDADAFVESGKMNYKKNSALVKSYISGVQGSGSINHIWSQGATMGAGAPINKLTKSIYDEAITMPEGAQVYRWMDDDTAGDIMTKQLLQSAPGTVLQNTDSMCTSFKEAWGATDNPHFCSEPHKAILMRIRCADGAKITPSYGSGSHWGERELTTLPGARFVVVSVSKGDHRHPNGIVVDCIMLPPDEGFVAQLSGQQPLAKAIATENSECLHKMPAQPSKAIVFLRLHSASRTIAT